jgi:cystathionine beta-lyase/cystathionine gamma-synthase
MRGFGGVLSFEVRGGIEAAKALLAGLSLPIYAPSLGGVETLITLPALSSHSGVPAAQRGIMGITDSLLRVAVGIEDEQDLWEDFSRALDRLR